MLPAQPSSFLRFWGPHGCCFLALSAAALPRAMACSAQLCSCSFCLLACCTACLRTPSDQHRRSRLLAYPFGSAPAIPPACVPLPFSTGDPRLLAYMEPSPLACIQLRQGGDGCTHPGGARGSVVASTLSSETWMVASTCGGCTQHFFFLLRWVRPYSHMGTTTSPDGLIHTAWMQPRWVHPLVMGAPSIDGRNHLFFYFYFFIIAGCTHQMWVYPSFCLVHTRVHPYFMGASNGLFGSYMDPSIFFFPSLDSSTAIWMHPTACLALGWVHPCRYIFIEFSLWFPRPFPWNR